METSEELYFYTDREDEWPFRALSNSAIREFSSKDSIFGAKLPEVYKMSDLLYSQWLHRHTFMSAIDILKD